MDVAAQFEALLDLEARHEDLLERLDELDQRVKKVLRECLGGGQGPGGSSSAVEVP